MSLGASGSPPPPPPMHECGPARGREPPLPTELASPSPCPPSLPFFLLSPFVLIMHSRPPRRPRSRPLFCLVPLFGGSPFLMRPGTPFLHSPRATAGPAQHRREVRGARGGQPGKLVCGSHCSVLLQVTRVSRLAAAASVTFGIVRRRQKLTGVKFHWMSRSAGESPARHGDWHGCPASRAVQWAFQ